MDDARTSATPAGGAPIRPTNSYRRDPRRAALRHRVLLRLPELALIVVVAALALGGVLQLGGGGSAARHGAGQAPEGVYTVGQVRAGLVQDPSSWVGRTIRISGVVQGPFVFCGRTNPCPPPTLGMVDDGNAILGASQYLPVEQDLRSAGSPFRFNVPATYRVALRASTAACSLNPDVLCYTGTVQPNEAGSR